MTRLKQTIRYDIDKKLDEDAEDWAWSDWLMSLVRFAKGDPIQDSFKIVSSSVEHYCQMDFYTDSYFTSSNFPVQPLDANSKNLLVTFSV